MNDLMLFEGFTNPLFDFCNDIIKIGIGNLFARSSAYLDYEDWIHAFCKRKYNSDFSREMSRSVAKYIEAFKSGR